MKIDELYRIHPQDTVGVTLKALDGIPMGHKIAVKDIEEGESVIKYGSVIGRATQKINKGEWVHTHNLRSHLSEEASYTYHYSAISPKPQKQTFWGYRRSNRGAGIRNEIYIVPTVGCVNSVCMRLKHMAQTLVKEPIDGIFALTHQFGCSQLGEDQENIQKLLCGIAKNPNASFVLFVGLGCENNRLSFYQDALKDYDHIAYFNCQEVEDELACGFRILEDMAQRASCLRRELVDFSELCIGLKCGGSDGFSGITANPLVGKISDRIVSLGASTILTEVPEMFGAEQSLMNKCLDQEIFQKYCKMIDDFKRFYIQQGFPVYENPSPGNREGGITTLEEKSLGCVEKAGSSAICDVLSYGDCCKSKGVTALNAPGNDLIAATALAAAGCQLVLFTTGRGTPFSTFVPTMKISSNAQLALKKSAWIDFDASCMDEQALFALICDVVNGAYRCKSEDIREIAFFKTGVTL